MAENQPGTPDPASGGSTRPEGPGPGGRQATPPGGAPSHPDRLGPRRSTHQPAPVRGTTVRAGGLLAVTLLSCLVAALLGATPLANWASGLDLPVVGTAADAWLGIARQVGLDRPYDALRRIVRRAEAASFGDGD
jgi:hypothetical protein